ncbi:MAG: hypothetical protein O6829_09140 [Alphaproteobacteria bacterium]|nr:hypothetical protein [Alphaproteobacteria bacterium]
MSITTSPLATESETVPATTSDRAVASSIRAMICGAVPRRNRLSRPAPLTLAAITEPSARTSRAGPG